MSPITLRSAKPEIIQIATEWLDRNINLSDNSRNVRRMQLNHLFDYFKAKVLTIDNAQLNAFLGHLRHEKRFRSETVSSSMKTARAFLTHLEERGLRDPVHWKLQKLPRDQTRATAFELNHYLMLLDRAKALEIGYTYWPTAICVGWCTGLRISDVASLQWRAVDFADDLLRVEPIKLSNVRQHLEIPLDPELRQCFQALLDLQREPPGPEDWVMPNMAMCGESRLTSEFRKLCEECGLPDYTFKSFRHALVTRLLNAHVDSRIIGSITGQSVFTVQRYVRNVTVEAKSEALAKARAGLSKARMQTLNITLPTFAQ